MLNNVIIRFKNYYPNGTYFYVYIKRFYFAPNSPQCTFIIKPLFKDATIFDENEAKEFIKTHSLDDGRFQDLELLEI